MMTVATSTLSLSKKIFDGGEAFEKASIAKDNIKLHTTKVKLQCNTKNFT